MVIANWESARDDARFRDVLDSSLIEDVDVPEDHETPEGYAHLHRGLALTH